MGAKKKLIPQDPNCSIGSELKKRTLGKNKAKVRENMVAFKF